MRQSVRLGKILAIVMAMAATQGHAQAGLYSLAAVPDIIKANAAVVVHTDATSVEVDDIEHVTVNSHRVITVMNETGRSALQFVAYSSTFSSLADAEIRVFDGNGKQVEKYKKKDMSTVAYGEGLVPDGKITYLEVKPASYPVTVEISYQQKLKGTYSIPSWHYIHDQEGVVSADYTLKVPADFAIRYKPEYTDVAPMIATEGNTKVYRWAVSSLAPIPWEEGSASGNTYPHIDVVADQFYYMGYRGDFSSWQKFGIFFNELYKGLDELPPARKAFFNSMVKDAATDRDKAKLIYAYLQHNFRYVSIQLGIGGFRPFSAEFTDQQKYGDCKALSNFMMAALKSVGVRSHVAIINARYNSRAVDPDFPADNFNHVILCIPQPTDSIWLECTSSTASFGVLGSFTENRNALLLTENGGALVPTPASHSYNNILRSSSNVMLEADESAVAITTLHGTGDFAETLGELTALKKDEQKQALVRYLGFKQPDDFLIEQSADKETTTIKTALSKLPEFASGDKLFLSPRFSRVWMKKLPKADNRKLDYYFQNPFEKYDTTIYRLPPGSRPETMLKEKHLACPYSTYDVNCWYNEKENAIYVATTLVLKQLRIPSADYPLIQKLFDQIQNDHSQKLVVTKGTVEKKAF